MTREISLLLTCLILIYCFKDFLSLIVLLCIISILINYFYTIY